MESLDQVNILVVDDEEIPCSLLTRMLEKSGYCVTAINLGVETLSLLKMGKTDLVLLDAKIPDVSGFDLLRDIKSRFPEVAVIMMTASADSFAIKDALLNGADEYVTKPFKNYEVSIVVERALWRQMNNRPQSEDKLLTGE